VKQGASESVRRGRSIWATTNTVPSLAVREDATEKEMVAL